MSDLTKSTNQDEAMSALDKLINPSSRRDFFRYGTAGIAALTAAACDTENTRTITETLPPDTIEVAPTPPTFAAVTLNFSNDFGVLNYAYALEQLEAAFYTQAVATPYAGITDAETRVLTDLRDHEVIHRDFYKAAIPAVGGTVIGALTPDFSRVDFSDRFSVLTTARTFEDLGVAAYNGAGQFLSNPTFLVLAGKIVSVEARHAAAIRDILAPRTGAFAPSAFDEALPPQVVLSAAAPFIRNRVSVTNVPSGFVSANLNA